MSPPSPIEEDTALFPKKSRYIKTDKPRPFRCPICTRGFVRQEHLKRHQIAHTRERPYLCVLCGRCFARRDLVLRHQTKLHPTLNQSNTNNTNNYSSNLDSTGIVTLDNNNNNNKDSNNGSSSSSGTSNNINNNIINNNNNIIAMFDESLQEDLNQLNPSLKQDNIENGILKIVGNTETILPVGLGKKIKKKILSNKTKTTTTTTRKQKSSSVPQSLTDLPNDAPLGQNDSFSASGPPLNYTKITKNTPKSKASFSFTQQQQQQQQSVESIKPFAPKPQPNIINGILNNTTAATTATSHTNSTITNINDSSSENIVPLDFINSSTLPLKEVSRRNVINSSVNGPNGIGPPPLHLNSQHQFLKVDQYGMLDQDPFSIPSSRMSSAQSQPLIHNPINNSNNNNNSGYMNHMHNIDSNRTPSLYPPSTVHMDTLSMGPLNNGSTPQNMSTRMNLNAFEYQSSDTNPSSTYLPYGQMWVSTDRNIKTPVTNFFTLESQSNISNTNRDIPTTVTSTTTNNNTTDTEDLFEDPWINKLLSNNLTIDFKVDPKNFNNIGFYPSSSLKSTSSSSCSSISSVSLTNENANMQKDFSSNLFEGISAYFTSRQLDISEAQKESLNLQKEVTNLQTDPSSLNIDPNLAPMNSVSNNICGINANQANNTGKDDTLRLSFDAKQTSSMMPTSNSAVNTFQELVGPSVNNTKQYPINQKMVPVSSGTGLNVGKYIIFDDQLRNFIIQENKLSDDIFPTVNQLNDYINLYHLEFGIFVPFIHISSLHPSQDNYPLLTAMAMIGALYAFRSPHTKILSNITMAQLTKHLQHLQKGTQPMNSHGDNPLIPIWILQTMTLVNVLGVFNNNGKLMREMNTYMMSLINLILKYNVNLPLEQFMEPPDIMLLPTEKQLSAMFKYFILAQERIRLCHSILLLSNLFASLVGLQCGFHSIDLKCGVPTIYEDLFECSDPIQWYQILQRRAIIIDSKLSLIQLANGNQLYENCLSYLTSGDPFFFQNAKLSKSTMLSLLVSIHEKISTERSNCISQLLRDTNVKGGVITSNLTVPRIDQYWKAYFRPSIEIIIQYWEKLFIKNGGILDINAITIPMIDRDPLIKIIIPYYIFAKMRVCLDLAYVTNRIWLKDWTNMNILLDEISYDWNTLREIIEYCIYIIESWISMVIAVRKIPSRNFTEKGGYRTPITTITTLFAAVCIISEYLKRVENWATNINTRHGPAVTLESVDRTLYLKIFMTLKKVQNVLLSSRKSMKSYLEFLQIQTKQHFNNLSELDDANEIDLVTAPNVTVEQLANLIDKLKLSSRALYLGVRILGDYPVWPIVMVFAHALQSRAIFNVSSGQHV